MAKTSNKQWPQDIRERVKWLIIHESMSLSDAAAKVGVPVGTVKRWSTDEKWAAIRDGQGHYGRDVVELKQALLRKSKEAIKTNASDYLAIVDAWAKVERTYPEKHYGGEILGREAAIQVFDRFTTHIMQRDPDTQHVDWLRQQMAMWFGEME